MNTETMTREDKQEIDRLVDIWIDQILSMSEEAGWRGQSLIARFMAFGCLPPAGTNTQADAGMIMAVDRLKNPHFEYPRIAAAISILFEDKPEYMAALLAKNFYQSSRINEATSKAYTDEDRAAILAVDVRTYQYHLGKSYYAMKGELRRIDVYINIKKSPDKSAIKKFFGILDNR